MSAAGTHEPGWRRDSGEREREREREREMEALRVGEDEARAEIDEDESETARRGEEAAGRCASLNYSPIRGPKSPSNNRAQQPLHAASV